MKRIIIFLALLSTAQAQQIPAYCHWWGTQIWCDDSPKLFSFAPDGWTVNSPLPNVRFDKPWKLKPGEEPPNFFVTADEWPSDHNLLTCKMPTQETVSDCKLGDGATIEQVVNAFLQSQWQQQNQQEQRDEQVRKTLEDVRKFLVGIGAK